MLPPFERTLQRLTDARHAAVRNRKLVQRATCADVNKLAEEGREKFSPEDILSVGDLVNATALH